MKNLLLIFIIAIIIISCRENIFIYPEETSISKVIVDSNPAGAYIFLSSQYSGKVTPDTLFDISPGEYSMRLKLSGFRDTSINLLVNPNVVLSFDVNLKSIYD